MVATPIRQTAAAGTETAIRLAGRGDWLAVLRILLIVQGSVAAVSTVELFVVGAATGGLLLPLAMVSLCGTAVTLALAARIGRGSHRARRIVLLLQGGWLVMAVIDLALAIILTQQPFELVPLLTRVALPLAIVRTLRTEKARLLFGVGPSRRQRRKARRAQRIEGKLG